MHSVLASSVVDDGCENISRSNFELLFYRVRTMQIQPSVLV